MSKINQTKKLSKADKLLGELIILFESHRRKVISEKIKKGLRIKKALNKQQNIL